MNTILSIILKECTFYEVYTGYIFSYTSVVRNFLLFMHEADVSGERLKSEWLKYEVDITENISSAIRIRTSSIPGRPRPNFKVRNTQTTVKVTSYD